MALYTDGQACGIDDLTDHDSGLLDVAEASGINVTTKIRLAQEDIASDLELWLARRPAQGVKQVVVSGGLKRWVAMHTLELVYRDAYYSQLVDRYQAKWQEFTRLTRDAREGVIAAGLPMVNNPLSQPAPPVLSVAAGPQSGGTFYASIAWVGPNGQEGAASAASSLTVANGYVMVMTPPTAPEGVGAYRVYAGPALAGMILQTPVALPAGVTFRYLPGQISQGPGPGTGQPPDFVRSMPRIWMRG